jgi:hypothetical protein
LNGFSRRVKADSDGAIKRDSRADFRPPEAAVFPLRDAAARPGARNIVARKTSWIWTSWIEACQIKTCQIVIRLESDHDLVALL